MGFGLAFCAASGQIRQLSPADFKKEIDKNKGILLDIRTPKETAEGFIPNALQSDFLAGDFQKEIQQIDKNQPVYVYCRSGRRSQKALQIFREKGFKNVGELQGGFLQWEKLGFPVERKSKIKKLTQHKK